MSKHDPIAVVQAYVASHRAWNENDYTISEDHKENGLTAYLVFYLPDKKVVRPGAGNSFLAYYDPTTGEVVRAVRFQ